MEKYICKIHNLNPDNLQSEKNLNFTLFIILKRWVMYMHGHSIDWLTPPFSSFLEIMKDSKASLS